MANIGSFAEMILHELAEYSEEVDSIMQKRIEKKSKEICNMLKTHPNIPVNTGEYKKGFKIKKAAQGTGYKRNIIYNKKGQITQLLERGHATRNGGRTKAYPHWKDAQKMADELYEEMMKELKT